MEAAVPDKVGTVDDPELELVLTAAEAVDDVWAVATRVVELATFEASPVTTGPTADDEKAAAPDEIGAAEDVELRMMEMPELGPVLIAMTGEE